MKKTLLWTTLIALTSTPMHAESTQPQANTATPNTSVSPSTALKTTTVVMNCDYKIPADTKKIDPSTVSSWSEKAVIQSFDLDHNTVDNQMQQLQACFTEQGWEGFTVALQKSGNMDAIKSQKLNVSSQIDGKIDVTESKENQWTVLLPVQVVYQNEKEKVTQLLSVNLTVGRKKTGELGIMQMVATPRGDEIQKPEANTATTTAAESKSISNTAH